MNPEMLLVISGIVGLAFSITAAFFYSYAGRDGTSKAWRRFLAPGLVLLGLNTVTLIQGGWEWKVCLGSVIACLLLMLGYCCGYGGETIGVKIFRRSVVATIYVLSGLSFALFTAVWTIFAFHCVLAVFTVILGVTNPTPAAKEEMLIGLFSQLMLFFMI